LRRGVFININQIIEGEREGFDGVLVDCFGDVGVKTAREITNIPVVGPGEASMVFAVALGHRFSVITVLKSAVPIFKRDNPIVSCQVKNKTL